MFMQPEFWEAMSIPEGSDKRRVLRGARGELLPPGVPPLESRWTQDETFGDFVKATIAAYH